MVDNWFWRKILNNIKRCVFSLLKWQFLPKKKLNFFQNIPQKRNCIESEAFDTYLNFKKQIVLQNKSCEEWGRPIP